MLKIFIGLLIVFLNLEIGGFDISADFIGLVFIYLGLNEYPDIVSFRKAKPITIVLFAEDLILSALNLALTLFPEAVSKIAEKTNLTILAAMAIPVVIVYIYQLYCITKGIGELEEKTGLDLNYQKLFGLWKKNRTLMLISSIISTISMVFAILGWIPDQIDSYDTELLTLVYSVITVITAIFVIMLLVIEIKQLICIYKAKEALDAYRPEEAGLQDYEQPTEE
ncbi:MAG: hypothetical protein IJN38_08690 [Clostridia bacterium]|nr:hypothetical protein [Clostridia bacterium]